MQSAVPGTAPTAPRSGHLPLADGASLGLWPQACLAVRAGGDACQACEAACPAAALSVDASGPHLGADCLRCGRCSAACPSGALRDEGFMGVQLPAGQAPVRIDCAKAPPAHDARTLRVPCLGGISTAQLLAWWLDAGAEPLMAVNRGWCEACAAGGGAFAGQQVLAQAQSWLQDMGIAPSRWPGVLKLDSRTAAPAAIRPCQGAAAPPVLSRRGFFRRLTTEVHPEREFASLPAGPRAAMRAEPAPVPARAELLEVLQRIATQLQTQVPSRCWPALTVSDRCDDHGVCASACPTGALNRQAVAGRSVLSLDAGRCVSCSRCVAACPQDALRLEAGGSPTRTVLRSFALRECVQCGADLPAQREGNLCARCASGVALGRAMFGTRVADI